MGLTEVERVDACHCFIAPQDVLELFAAGAGFANSDHVVDAVLRLDQTLEDVGPRLRFAQVKRSATLDDGFSVGNVGMNHGGEGQQDGPTVKDPHHVGRVGFLQSTGLEQLIEHSMRIGVVFDLDDDANALLGGFVADVANAHNHFFVDQIGDLNQHVGLFHLVRDFMDDDAFSLLVVEHFALCTDVEATFSGGVHVGDAVDAVNGCTRGEIRTFHVLHVLFYRDVWFSLRPGFKEGVDVEVDRTGHLSEVVRWNAGGHSDGDTVASVEEQIWQTGGQDRGFVFRIVKVRLEINRVLVDVVEHVLCDAIEPTFRVPHGGRRVAVDRAKVPLPVHQRIAQGKFLGHSHHRVVDGLITVRVVLSHHLAHRPSGFGEFLVRGVAALKHAVEDPAMNGFQAVPSVGKSPPDDDGHGVIDVGIFHFGVEGVVQDDFA